MRPFDYTAFSFGGGVRSRKPINRFVTVVTPTDRPKSVRNRDVIEVFGGVVCCHVAF